MVSIVAEQSSLCPNASSRNLKVSFFGEPFGDELQMMKSKQCCHRHSVCNIHNTELMQGLSPGSFRLIYRLCTSYWENSLLLHPGKSVEQPHHHQHRLSD